MMIPQSIQATQDRENRELAISLHREARLRVFERTMGNINDTLAAILGTCDVKAKEIVPLIKSQIHAINTRLKEARNYYAEYSQKGVFSVNTACLHMLAMVEAYFDNRSIAIERDFANINALAVGDLECFEQFLLYLFLHLVNGNSDPAEIKMITRQKEGQILVIIRKPKHSFSVEELDLLKKRIDETLPDKVRIEPFDIGIEIIIRLPLKFPTAKITLSEPKLKTNGMIVKS